MVVTSLDFGLPSLTLMHESVKKQQEGDISQFLTASLIYAEKKNSREMKMSTTLQKIHPLLISNNSHLIDIYLLLSLLAYVCY